VVDLVGPNGSSYRLKNADLGDSTDNLNATYTVDASAQPCSGQWRLKVQDIDAEAGFTGYIDAWSINFN
jgi:subtilisin-like proprotein convertase family protein